jgi:peptidoglycan/xylan/chitin deacetylase (PgdA/CDA1 family)
MSRRQQAARLLSASGALKALHWYWGRQRLTVLAYHRIIEWQTDSFDDYEPVVSATPALFAQQMEWLEDYFSVISLWDLHTALTEGKPLPANPLLITFDDGYLDNYEHAFPVLRSRGFPAVIFLATSRMSDHRRLWWDEVAYICYHAPAAITSLPLLGSVSLTSKVQRRQAREVLIQRLKALPEAERAAVVESLYQATSIMRPQEPKFMNWEQVRELVSSGIACQPHTVNHPIMTRISAQEQKHELAESAAAIARETGQTITAFAYPNGTPADYDRQTIQALQETGYTMAFTLTAGPMRWQDVVQHPYEIKRVYLGLRDTMEIFAAKVLGVPALLDRTPFYT